MHELCATAATASSAVRCRVRTGCIRGKGAASLSKLPVETGDCRPDRSLGAVDNRNRGLQGKRVRGAGERSAAEQHSCCAVLLEARADYIDCVWRYPLAIANHVDHGVRQIP